MFEVVQAEAAVKLTVPKKMMAEVAQALEAWESKGMASFKEVQQLTGRLSCIAGSSRARVGQSQLCMRCWEMPHGQKMRNVREQQRESTRDPRLDS